MSTEREDELLGNGLQDDLNQRFNRLASDTRKLISAYTNHFLEPDVKKGFLSSPDNLGIFQKELERFGLDEEAIDVAFEMLGFPPIPKEPEL